MRRHLRGEKTGFDIELKGIKTLIFWFLLVDTALSQIPINGFCQLNTFHIIPGYKKFVVADINYDSFIDYILYSYYKNSIQILERVKDTTFTNYRIFSLNYISSLVPVYDSITGSMQFFFLDRERRTAGLFYLSTKNRLNIIDKITFDSYPENVSVGDVNEDGSMDYLISGPGFKGLSLLQLRSDKLTEANFRNDLSYGEAIFADISNDGYSDIVAFNLFKNRLDVFFNDEAGNFEFIRSIPLKGSIENLKAIHNDDYDDIVFSSEGSINIITGDFESSYNNVHSIKTEYQPNKFVISDFNNDKLKDIAYIDTTRGTLSLIFAKSENQFYPEIIYLQKIGITDLKTIRKNYNNGLAVLDSNGKIFRITKLSILPDETKIVPAVQPSAIISFDYGNDSVYDLCYLDQSSNTLNFFISNYAGIPTYFFSTSLSTNYDRIVVDDAEQFKKGLYCYSPGKKLVEIVDYNFTKDESDNNQLYVPGAIKDLVIKKTNNLVHIYIAFEKDKALKIGEYEHHDFRFNYREYSYKDNNVIKAKLVIENLPELYYWKNYRDSLYLINTKTDSKTSEYRTLGVVKNVKPGFFKNINEFLVGDEYPEVLTLFETDSILYTSLFFDSVFTFTNQDIDSLHSGGDAAGIINFRFSSKKNHDNPVVYIPEMKLFIRIETKLRKGKLFVQKLFDVKNVKDFVVQQKNKNDIYLIYTIKSEGFLTLKRLK